MQFFSQFLYPLLYLHVRGIPLGKGLVDIVGLLKVTLLEIDLSKRPCRHLFR